jgi:hypothetical protein
MDIKFYISKEPEITQLYIYDLEKRFVDRYNESKNNQFSCPEFENLFACLFSFLESSLKSIDANQYSLIWSITQSLELIKNCSQITVCTNTEINKCPNPDINLDDQKYYANPKIALPCSNNVYQTPYNGAIFPYAYCIRVLVRIMHIIDMINLYMLTKEMEESEKTEYYESPYAYIYFRNRYEYYLDYLLSEAPNVFILPILQSVGATTLISVRGSKIQICGVIFEKTFVDEAYQSPGNFFWHDINHARRIYQNNLWYATNHDMNLETLYLKMKEDVDKLLPISKWIGANNGFSSIIKMLLFEIVHEDALPFLLDELIRDIIYEVGECYPYERTKEVIDKPFQRKNIRFYEQGATTMATLYNKIRHKFFESDIPLDMIVKIKLRNANNLSEGTMILINKIYDLKNMSVPETITYDKIITLIASQDYSHHKDEELPNLPEDIKFDEKQKSLLGTSAGGENLKKTKNIYKKNNKSIEELKAAKLKKQKEKEKAKLKKQKEKEKAKLKKQKEKGKAKLKKQKEKEKAKPKKKAVKVK